MKPAILLLGFNRPDLAEQVLAKIRVFQPEQLFLAVDGPRKDCPDDATQCRKMQLLVNRVDWPCEINTLFRDENLGCRRAVSGAITWFFDHVEEGLILEDDCIPDHSFFYYCSDLLKRYRDTSRVMCISGSNFQQGQLRGNGSYYFSIYNHCWGWASWRRAWNLYDDKMTDWRRLSESGQLSQMLGPVGASAWQRRFDSVKRKTVDSWAYTWTYSCWVHHGLTALPNRNLTTNIGFDERATHTRSSINTLGNRPLQSLDLPLTHPPNVERDVAADQFTQRHLFQTYFDYLRALCGSIG